MAAVILCGCSADNEQDRFAKATAFLNSIEYYFAEIKLDIEDEDQIRSYRYKQWVDLANGRYRMEVLEPELLEGKVTVSDGRKTWMYHPQVEDMVELKYPEVYQEVPVFVGDFLSRYWDSEKASMEEVNVDGKEYIELSCPSVGMHSHYRKEKLHLDMHDKKPVSLLVMDENDNPIARITFESFRVLPHLEDELFQVKKNANS